MTVNPIDRVEFDNDGTVITTASTLDDDVVQCMDCNLLALANDDVKEDGRAIRRVSIGAHVVFDGYKIPIMIHMEKEIAYRLGLFLCANTETRQ